MPHAPLLVFGLGLVMHASQFGGLDEGGAGPVLQIGLGRDRVQPFTELALSGDGVTGAGFGMSARADGGVRVRLRSTPAEEATFDLVGEAFAGVDHIQWSGGHRTRPEIGVGLGWQVRTHDHDDKPFAIRVMTRVFVAPSGGDAPAPTSDTACRGAADCEMAPAPMSFGFDGTFGVEW